MTHAPTHDAAPAAWLIGAACRFPGADGVDAYWRLLLDGRVVAAEPGPERADLWAAARAPALAGRVTTLKGGYLRDVAGFDADYFSIAPREAARLDPQQRMLLTVTHDAFEDAGITRAALRELKVGVFIGAGSTDYMTLCGGDKAAIDAYHGIGNSHSLLANRLSYYYNLKGPSLTIDTACSSSLTALHVALQALERDALDLVLVGGVNLIAAPDLTLAFSQAGMLSPSGRCRTFAADADGYGRAEGVGVVVLTRTPAFAPRARCAIRASAVNQDGRSNGITAPNGLSQVEVIRAALARAGLGPTDLGYVETHGTGTRLGDALEIDAVRVALGAGEADADACWHLGSAKANVGHMEAAAGMGGLIKAMLMLEHGMVPPHPIEPPHNPLLDAAQGRLAIAARATPLRANACVGVSSFGFGGSNAHVIVARADVERAEHPAADEQGPQLLLLSSRSAAPAEGDARALAARLVTGEVSLARAAATLARPREPLGHRGAIVAHDLADAVRQLDAAPPVVARARAPRLAFVFTGQGSQYAGMGAALYAHHAAFRAHYDACAAHIAACSGRQIADLMQGGERGERALLDDTHLAQLALFCLEYALAHCLLDAGAMPEALIGHSLGELVAQTVGGMLTLEDAVALVHERGRLMQAADGMGAMLNVFGTGAQVRDAIARSGLPIHLAGINGVRAISVSGAREAIEAFAARAEAEGLACRALPTRHAFHSPALGPAAAQLAAYTRTLATGPARIPVISNLDGASLDTLPPGSDYWSRQLVAPVEFRRGIEALVARGCDLFVEIGPDRILSGLIARDHGAAGVLALATQRRGADGLASLLDALGQLHAQQVTLRADALSADCTPARLPARGLDAQPYWDTPPVAPVRASAPASAPVATAARPAGAFDALVARQLDVIGSQLAVLRARHAASLPPWSPLQ